MTSGASRIGHTCIRMNRCRIPRDTRNATRQLLRPFPPCVRQRHAWEPSVRLPLESRKG